MSHPLHGGNGGQAPLTGVECCAEAVYGNDQRRADPDPDNPAPCRTILSHVRDARQVRIITDNANSLVVPLCRTNCAPPRRDMGGDLAGRAGHRPAMKGAANQVLRRSRCIHVLCGGVLTRVHTPEEPTRSSASPKSTASYRRGRSQRARVRARKPQPAFTNSEKVSLWPRAPQGNPLRGIRGQTAELYRPAQVLTRLPQLPSAGRAASAPDQDLCGLVLEGLKPHRRLPVWTRSPKQSLS